MLDIREVLHAAAAEPRRPVDMYMLRAEASRPAWRRRIGLLIAGLGVVGLAAVPGLNLSPAGHDDQRVDTSVPRIDDGSPPQPSAQEIAAGPATTIAVSAGSPPGQRTAHGPTTTTAPAYPQYPELGGSDEPPSTTGCTTAPGFGHTTDYGSVGYDDPDDRGCSYVASVAGGYRANGSWTITIRRDGRAITLDNLRNDACGPIGTIQPGDEVTASARTAGLSTADGYVEVGERSHC